MANTNCLAGIRCPQCGSYEPFDIVVETVAKIYDDGVDHTRDTEWDSDSFLYCCNCDDQGIVSEFKTQNKEHENAQSRNKPS